MRGTAHCEDSSGTGDTDIGSSTRCQVESPSAGCEDSSVFGYASSWMTRAGEGRPQGVKVRKDAERKQHERQHAEDNDGGKTDLEVVGKAMQALVDFLASDSMLTEGHRLLRIIGRDTEDYVDMEHDLIE